MTKKLYIETVGCQMNVLDSELIVSGLLQSGYEVVAEAADADTILFNTCSVRQHAEDKIYSALGRVRQLKHDKPETVVGVLGCMAQKDQGLIFRRAGCVDVVVGPGQFHRLPEILGQFEEKREPMMEVSLDRFEGSRTKVEQSFARFDPPRPAALRPSRYQAMVRIMFGCDKFCTYCIVPKVRGPEQSRTAAEIEREVRQLADDGCLEVLLLGQTVNSYKDISNGQTLRLSDLLVRLHDIPGLRRIKFLTNYPRHMTDDLLEAVRDLPKVSPYLHVPVQSGSNEVLKRMKRGYTVEQYKEMYERIRATVPKAAVTSDFIVGFCGETEEDFQQSIDIVRWARFKNSFIFKYSERPGTKAADAMKDDIPEEVKRRRNNELLDVQNQICYEDTLSLAGQMMEVLVEGPSKAALRRQPELGSGQYGGGDIVQLVGRTTYDQIVVFEGPMRLVGQIMDVHIDKVDPFTLFGSVPEAALPTHTIQAYGESNQLVGPRQGS
jgi:tRNA-2-methylthio-N6-dimethylallyladenosine synthase